MTPPQRQDVAAGSQPPHCYESRWWDVAKTSGWAAAFSMCEDIPRAPRQPATVLIRYPVAFFGRSSSGHVGCTTSLFIGYIGFIGYQYAAYQVIILVHWLSRTIDCSQQLLWTIICLPHHQSWAPQWMVMNQQEGFVNVSQVIVLTTKNMPGAMSNHG